MSAPLSAVEVKRHKWWGWGLDDVTFNWRNKPGFRPLAKEKIGLDLAAMPDPVIPDLSEYEVPASRLGAQQREAFARVVGAENVLDDDEMRVVHSFGRSLPDLFRVRHGDFARIVDAVVYPGSEDRKSVV